MRRTEQEFKEELLRRTKVYRQEQARKRKRLLGVGICACLCCAVLTFFGPFGASSEAPAARDDLKLEAAVSMQAVSGSDAGMITDSAAAPMAPVPEEAKSEAPAAESVMVIVSCGDDAIILDETEAESILGYLMSDRWIPTAANCLCDYTLDVSGEIYRYHSDCGTIQNELGESLILSESEREMFNNIMGRCPMRIDE